MKTLNKNEKIAVAICLVVVGFFFLFGQHLFSFFLTKPTDNNITKKSEPQFQDVILGQGTEIKPGNKIDIFYTVRLINGDVVDSNANSSPLSFVLGQGHIIPGLEIGLLGMKVGGKRVVVIPPELGYGNQDLGPIPANSTLIFEVEVVSAE